jgi:hypothetical protein
VFGGVRAGGGIVDRSGLRGPGHMAATRVAEPCRGPELRLAARAHQGELRATGFAKPRDFTVLVTAGWAAHRRIPDSRSLQLDPGRRAHRVMEVNGSRFDGRPSDVNGRAIASPSDYSSLTFKNAPF